MSIATRLLDDNSARAAREFLARYNAWKLTPCAGTFEHYARACVSCHASQQPFARPDRTQDRGRCTGCGRLEGDLTAAADASAAACEPVEPEVAGGVIESAPAASGTPPVELPPGWHAVGDKGWVYGCMFWDNEAPRVDKFAACRGYRAFKAGSIRCLTPWPESLLIAMCHALDICVLDADTRTRCIRARTTDGVIVSVLDAVTSTDACARLALERYHAIAQRASKKSAPPDDETTRAPLGSGGADTSTPPVVTPPPKCCPCRTWLRPDDGARCACSCHPPRNESAPPEAPRESLPPEPPQVAQEGGADIPQVDRHQATLARISAIADAALKHYGPGAQLRKLIEEMAELTVALSHYEQGRCSTADVITEIADVGLVLAQVERIFGEGDALEECLRKALLLEERMKVEPATAGSFEMRMVSRVKVLEARLEQAARAARGEL